MLDWMLRMMIENGFRGYILPMPNIQPAVLDSFGSVMYEGSILSSLSKINVSNIYTRELKFLMTIQLTESTTKEDISGSYAAGVRHIKVYPRDVTTNSELGISDYEKIYPMLEWAESLGMFVHFHCEHPSYDVEGKDKENVFFDKILWKIVNKFPKLKIVVEHISTIMAVQFVEFWNKNGRNIAATIATPYLILTQDDVIGYSKESGCKGNMHHLCKPSLKWRADRQAIREAAVSGKPYFFLGTDTAPHLSKSKYNLGCACGNFSTTVTSSIIVSMFEEFGLLDPEKIGYFASHAGADHFGLPRLKGTVTLEKWDWTVPEMYEVPGTEDYVVPMCAGWTMPWSIVF